MSLGPTPLYLLRHAHAGDAAGWRGDDAARPLSERGRRQSEAVGRLLASIDEPPDLFITSPRLRAAETAEIVAAALGTPIVLDARLAGDLDATVVEGMLRDAGDARRPCLVGHDPAFSELLGELLGVDAMPMRKGAVARVDVERPVEPGFGVLRWLVPPELLPGGGRRKGAG